MAFGKLASMALPADALTVVYTAPSNAVVGIIINNTNNFPVVFGISIGTNATPALADYILVNSVLGPCVNPISSKHVIEKIPMSAGEMIQVLTDTPGVVIRVQGADGTDITTAKYSY